jgi:hypothetical protein
MTAIGFLKKNNNLKVFETCAPQKMLVLNFVSGKIAKQIILDPEEMPIVFGRPDPN